MNEPEEYDIDVFQGWTWNPLKWISLSLSRITNAEALAKVERLEQELVNLRFANQTMQLARDTARHQRDEAQRFINTLVGDLEEIRDTAQNGLDLVDDTPDPEDQSFTDIFQASNTELAS